MTGKQYGGVEIICGTMLPPNTIYCSEDIFFELKKLKTEKGMVERLKILYGVGV